MRRLCLFLNTIWMVVLLASPASAQGLRNRVVPVCTDTSDRATAVAEGFIDCEWLQAGTGATTPGYVRLVDQNTALAMDVERLSTIIAGIAGNNNASITAGTMWIYNSDTDTFIPWRRYTPSDTITNGRMTGPSVMSGNMGWVAVNSRWARFRLDTSFRLITSIQDPIDASGNVQVGIYDTSGGGPATFGGGAGAAGLRISPPNDLRFQISDDNNANTIANPIAVRLSQDGATAVGAANPLPVSKDMAANATGNRLWVTSDMDMVAGTATNVNGGLTDAGTQTVVTATDSPGVTTAAPGYSREQDGNSAVLKDVLDAVADGLALSLNWGASASVMLGYNGATLDMARINASGGIVTGRTWLIAGESPSDDWLKEKKEETAVYNPAVTAGTAVTDASAVICASTYVLNLPNWSVFVKNAGGGAADAFTDVDVQISYDGANWSSETSTACDTLASGVSARCYKGSNESVVYVQVIADVDAADTTTADCGVFGNKN